jgi:hypothetical protein
VVELVAVATAISLGPYGQTSDQGRDGWFVGANRSAGAAGAHPLARSLTLSFLLALTLFALLHHLKLTAGDAAATICLSALAGMLLSAIRGLIYTAVYHSPISLRGRIWTLRPIIPGYDYVLIAPLAMVITSIALPLALLAMGSPPDLAFALAAFAVILIGLAAPPTRFHWQLTGSHSISLAKVDAIELLDPASHPGRSVRLAGPQGARS